MRIGINYGGVASLEARIQKVEEHIQRVVDAEEDGFDSVWLAQIFGADALTIIALAGAKTKRIELGTSVIPIYSRHPFVLAQEALTVQAAIGGRLTLALTGRRRTEVLSLTRGDLSGDDGAVYYSYRGKGGKQVKRELPRPAVEAIQESLVAWGKGLEAMAPGESLWPTPHKEHAAQGLGVTGGTFYGNLRGYLRKAGLPAAGVHIMRHSAAKLRRDAGETVEDVSRFLDHSSLAVTTVYLRRLEGQEDKSWRKVASALGV